ncbi:unnamed protein product [Meloidogyne enterolobii]|uniref:Uncharacterized protein n=1 Tax=Meloidogyne enterolobii TaxID=390850 RepID=A0ACB1A9D0_MELEN
MPTKTTTTNRKRSAEICPHPPHLLNKRYWEEAKAGKARIPNKSGPQNVCTKKEIPSNSRNEVKKRFELPVSTPKIATNPLDINFLTTSSTLSDNIALNTTPKNILKSANYNNNQSNISPPTNIPPQFVSLPSSLPPFPFRLPINSKELTSLNFEELMRTAPPPQFNFQMFPPPPLLPPSFHFPPFPPPGFFPENSFFQQGNSTGLLNSSPPIFPQFLNEKQNFNKKESTALTQLMEIFNQKEIAKESTSQQQQSLNDYKQNFSGKEQKLLKYCDSDEQIDQMLDEMVKNKEKISNKRAKNLCILPLPVPIPIIVPVTNDFLLKYFSK